MTPAARIAAACVLLDEISDGSAAEKAMTGWARRSRFAGSKDRAAVRDHVFDALRRRRSYRALGGGNSGRALMLGALRARNEDPAEYFTGIGHAPVALTEEELSQGRSPEGYETWNLHDWLAEAFQASLGAGAEAEALALQHRAPIFARANLQKADLKQTIKALSLCDVDARPHALSHTALEITRGAGKLSTTQPYLDGWVELQDAASQAVSDALPLDPGHRVLDFCAGGGGKTLAMAARCDAEYFAHDIAPRRMKDLPTRADRAGVQVTQLVGDAVDNEAPFDLVLCDAPCSGSGSWRRAPAAKWALTEERLTELTQIQDSILDRGATLTAPKGMLAYATCSLLEAENMKRISAFLWRHPEWTCGYHRQFLLSEGGDGFFTAHLTRK